VQLFLHLSGALMVGNNPWRISVQAGLILFGWGSSVGLGCVAPREGSALIEPTSDLSEKAFLAAAWKASGVEEIALRRGMQASFESIVLPVVQDVRGIADPRDRAQRLLERLHDPTHGVFRRYDPRATTLVEVVEGGAYNCVSSAVVYNLLAERVGLDVGVQLLPTHVRSLVYIDRTRSEETVTVETTSAGGFAPSSEMQARIFRLIGGSAVGEHPVVDVTGTVVSTGALLGVMYLNRASVAREAQRYREAEVLLTAAEAYFPEPSVREVLHDQRASLLAELAVDRLQTKGGADRAFVLLLTAAKLQPKAPSVRYAVSHNLLAAAESLVRAHLARGAESEALGVVASASTWLELSDRMALRAFTLSEIALHQAYSKEFDRALASIRGARLALSNDPGASRDVVIRNHGAILRMAALHHARGGDYAGSSAYLDRLEWLAGEAPDLVFAPERDRRSVLILAGQRRLAKKDIAGAATIFRDGVQRFPDDGEIRKELVAVLQNQVQALIDRGRCGEVSELMEELVWVEREPTYARKARAACLRSAALAREKAGDTEESARLLEEAHALDPDPPGHGYLRPAEPP
jgi:tetratricopeptide (TPR) repeat protein